MGHFDASGSFSVEPQTICEKLLYERIRWNIIESRRMINESYIFSSNISE